MTLDKALPFMPRGLTRTQAALYIGVGTTTFDEMVKDGRMPQPKEIGQRRVWDKEELDASFETLPTKGEANQWDAA